MDKEMIIYLDGFADGLNMANNSTNKMLDKIRAEIERILPTYHNPDWSITDLVPISEVLDVIDKYKVESEE